MTETNIKLSENEQADILDAISIIFNRYSFDRKTCEKMIKIAKAVSYQESSFKCRADTIATELQYDIEYLADTKHSKISRTAKKSDFKKSLKEFNRLSKEKSVLFIARAFPGPKESEIEDQYQEIKKQTQEALRNFVNTTNAYLYPKKPIPTYLRRIK